jgi:PAS domain S-box-containing protein
MIVVLRPDHTIAYFSPFAERLTGYSAQKVLGRDYVHLLLPEEHRRAVADELARVLAGRPTPGYENPVQCRDGTKRWMTWNARALPDFDGSPGLLKVGQDITYLKQAQERAFQAERLAAIGQMVAGLAHESRNALQRGQACLEMLTLQVQDRPEALDLVARIQKAQDDLHHLYEGVRDYAAVITLQKRRCDLRDVWREAWANLEPARLGKAVSFKEPSNDVDLICFADPFRLGQVFQNLFENAIAAGSGTVDVEVTAQPLEADGRQFIRIGVSDNGPGMSIEQRRRAFEPFFTTKTRGTGLGLPIARRIVETHGGTIAIAGIRPQGALFFINLPRGLP